MEAQLDNRLQNEGVELKIPTGSVAEALWQQGRRESSHEAMLTDMLSVYRQNCELREQVNKLLGLIEEKDTEIVHLRSQRHPEVCQEAPGSSAETPYTENTQRLQNQYDQLKAANDNLWKRYNDMDTVAMELEEKCRVLELTNQELDDRLKQYHRDRHYDEPCKDEDRALPEPQLSQLSFYHGKIGRKNAEKLLQTCQEGDFLIRNCDMSPSDYTLSVKHRETSRHFLVRSVGHRLFLGVNSFNGWLHLIEYHRQKSLFATNYRRLTLKSAISK